MLLLVGLGNPGPEHAGQRHNVGFMAADAIVRRHGFSPWRKKFQGDVAEGTIGGTKVVALKPATYMNLSGQSAAAAAQFYKIELADVIAIHDELDLKFGKTDKRVYENLMSDHPIDMTRYQVAGCYMGRAGLINSGGASGDNDLHDAVSTAVVNKRAGGMGMISGRKAFQRPRHEGIALLNAIQDVYLCDDVTIA